MSQVAHRTSGTGGWAWTVESEKELKRSKEKLPYIGRFPAISRSRHNKGDYRDTTVTKVTRNFVNLFHAYGRRSARVSWFLQNSSKLGDCIVELYKLELGLQKRVATLFSLRYHKKPQATL